MTCEKEDDVSSGRAFAATSAITAFNAFGEAASSVRSRVLHARVVAPGLSLESCFRCSSVVDGLRKLRDWRCNLSTPTTTPKSTRSRRSGRERHTLRNTHEATFVHARAVTSLVFA